MLRTSWPRRLQAARRFQDSEKGGRQRYEFIFIGVSKVFLRFPTRRFKMQEPAVYIENENFVL